MAEEERLEGIFEPISDTIPSVSGSSDHITLFNNRNPNDSEYGVTTGRHYHTAEADGSICLADLEDLIERLRGEGINVQTSRLIFVRSERQPTNDSLALDIYCDSNTYRGEEFKRFALKSVAFYICEYGDE